MKRIVLVMCLVFFVLLSGYSQTHFYASASPVALLFGAFGAETGLVFNGPSVYVSFTGISLTVNNSTIAATAFGIGMHYFLETNKGLYGTIAFNAVSARAGGYSASGSGFQFGAGYRILLGDQRESGIGFLIDIGGALTSTTIQGTSVSSSPGLVFMMGYQF